MPSSIVANLALWRNQNSAGLTREEEVVGLRSPDNQERLSPHQHRPFGGRRFGDTLFLPNDCQPRVGGLIWSTLRPGCIKGSV